MENVVVQFYSSWLVEWIQASKDIETLNEKWQELTNEEFSWIPADGMLCWNRDECGKPGYGSGALWNLLEIEVQNLEHKDNNQQPSKETQLLTFQVWIRHQDNQSPATTTLTVKQVTAWMRNCETTDDNEGSEWKISQLHETNVGYEPPQPGPVAPWKKTILASPHCLPSKRRHLHPALAAHGATPLIDMYEQVMGISIAGWDIGTSQGPIGDSKWFDQALQILEPLSQPRHSHTPPRQLALPEMVFPLAHVVLAYRGKIVLSLDAMDFLQAWSSAHEAIPLPSQQGDDESSPPSSRGVQVMETSDATLWKKKSMEANEGDLSPGIRSTTFHYDWTCSSPYSGTFYGGNTIQRTLPTSGMPMHLLTDQTAPILFFDQLVLLEDDLHDNGQMQFTVKVRVMPTCVYVLSQLFVRVDQVLIRVRESRWLVQFGGTIFRDVTWKECRWDDLAQYRLPTDVKAWTQNEAYAPPEAVAALAKQVQQLPVVSLPKSVGPPYTELVI